MKHQSIIAKPFVEQALTAARSFYERDGYLVPVLFVQFENEEQTLIPVDLPGNAEERHRYFQALGRTFRQSAKVLTEALFVAEGWYVAVDAPADLSVRPSTHPRRQSAITVIGRNAAKTAYTSVVQVVPDTTQPEAVWASPVLAAYGSTSDSNPTPVGLLDALFTA